MQRVHPNPSSFAVFNYASVPSDPVWSVLPKKGETAVVSHNTRHLQAGGSTGTREAKHNLLMSNRTDYNTISL